MEFSLTHHYRECEEWIGDFRKGCLVAIDSKSYVEKKLCVDFILVTS